MEYELLDTGVFNDDRYWDVFVEYRQGDARGRPDPDHRVQSRTGSGHAARAADAAVSQHLELGRQRQKAGNAGSAPARKEAALSPPPMMIVGERYLYCEGDAPLLFTENETNNERLFGSRTPVRT